MRGSLTKELNRAYRCDSIRGDEGIHPSSEQSRGIHAPAGVGMVGEQERKEGKSRKECGRHDCDSAVRGGGGRRPTLSAFIQRIERIKAYRKGVCLSARTPQPRRERRSE